MGCYGIGLGRIIATIIENNVIKENDEIKGFSLPLEIAPYKAQIIYKEDNKEIANNLYNELLKNSVNVIIDDRENLSIGARIKDVYVLGTPYIIVLGNNIKENSYEVENTKTGEKEYLNTNEIINLLK